MLSMRVLRGAEGGWANPLRNPDSITKWIQAKCAVDLPRWDGYYLV